MNKEEIKKQYQKEYYLINKEFSKKYSKEYRLNNKEKINELNKKYQLNNKEKIKENRLNNKEYFTQYQLKNKEKIKEQRKKYYFNNKEFIKEKKKEYTKEYYLKNKEKINELHKKYRLNNREKINEYFKKKYNKDSNYKLTSILRARVRLALKGNNKSASTMKLIGCSVNELWNHLESQFESWMTRENHGLWHVDHIVPCASFDLTSPEQQRICFNYKNLQPLEAIENIRKGAS